MQDITICDETAPEGKDIVVCPEEPIEDIEICVDCLELSLSGPELVAVGSIYTITGGVEPYTVAVVGANYTMDSATQIRITSINSCTTQGASRTGTITVTDSCDPIQTEELAVRYPSGTFVFSHSVWPFGSSDAAFNNHVACSLCCIPALRKDYNFVRFGVSTSTTNNFMMTDGLGQYYRIYRADNTSNLSFCQCTSSNGGSDCSFCSPFDQTAYYNCIKGVLPRPDYDINKVLPNRTGTPATSWLHTVETRDHVHYRVDYFDWVCP